MLPLLIVLLLLIAPSLAAFCPNGLPLLRAGIGMDPMLVAIALGGINLLAVLLCVLDKRTAQAGGQRVPELLLHALEAAGGWPGSLVAQRWARHKTAKLSYQLVFWAIVLGWQALAFDLLLDGLVARWLRG